MFGGFVIQPCDNSFVSDRDRAPARPTQTCFWVGRGGFVREKKMTRCEQENTGMVSLFLSVIAAVSSSRHDVRDRIKS